MSPLHSLHTRREFLRTGVLGGALATTVPSFLANTMSALSAAAAESATQTVTGREGRILVVLQMAWALPRRRC
jgi:cell division protein FtsX